MRIAIASTHFDETRHIGANRPRQFAKWLAAFGHDVTVITRKEVPAHEKIEPHPTLSIFRYDRPALMNQINAVAEQFNAWTKARADLKQSQQNHKSNHPHPNRDRSQWLKVPHLIFRMFDDAVWAAMATHKIKQAAMPNFDIVISSYGPFASHWIGQRMHQSRKAGAWIADFRDPLPAANLPESVKRILRAYERRSTEHASLVTTVSEGLKDSIRKSQNDATTSTPVFVLPNGFDLSQSSVNRQDQHVRDDVFRIGYTGSLYGGRSDASALFMALSTLIREKFLDSEQIEVHYAGRNGAVFRSQATPHNLDHIVIDHGFVSKELSGQIQRRCDLLIVLSWNDTGNTGILTGKVFEYMQSGKPILAMTTGLLPNAELSVMVERLSLGLAFEYVRADADTPKLLEFLENLYCKRILGVPLETNCRLSEVREYDYREIVRRLESFCYAAVGERAR